MKIKVFREPGKQLRKKNRERLAASALCLLLIFCAGCTAGQKEQKQEQEQEQGVEQSGAQGFLPGVVREDVDLPGYEGSCDLLFLSDLHIVEKDDPDVRADQMETVNQRYAAFSNEYGPAAEYWKKLSAAIDGLGADYVLLGGDMVDYCSESTVKQLKEGLDRIRTPWMYVRADHDLGN